MGLRVAPFFVALVLLAVGWDTAHAATTQNKHVGGFIYCIELMDSYATLLFAKIMEIKPKEFCKQYGLCRDIAFFSNVRTGSTCVFCRHLLDKIMSKLKDPDAEFEIIQILLKECSKIEGHVQQCKRLVLQYIPLILVNGEKFLEKNDVCALVQACDASPKRTVSSFLEEGILLSDA
ncbi:hypothetical protein EJB05_29935 [Eragrostis curvula]|uniref:Saposin B-type domain-containing protein n=1 Tax=Eragrostis curvula TaxID=38414 RepID=A0A5J9UU06_9POAL|nr:hypothetical protein EJB05_29935 [Eragrostis curvula]